MSFIRTPYGTVEVEMTLSEVLAAHPTLGCGGFWCTDMVVRHEVINWLLGWCSVNFLGYHNPNPRYPNTGSYAGSYRLKHIAEDYIKSSGGYHQHVANGELIMAMLMLGWRIPANRCQHEEELNCRFKVPKKILNAMRTIGPVPCRAFDPDTPDLLVTSGGTQ